MDSTSDCWQVLDLSGQCDERSVKRQYARLLKVTRPDEDPVAFQQLRDAYEQALQILREDRADATAADLTPPPISQSANSQSAPLVRSPSAQEQAVALLDGFEDSAIALAWSEAKAKGIEGAFERLLFQRCLSAAAAHPNLLNWGIEKRQWLTPWQQFPTSEFEQQRLSQILVAVLYDTLEQQLAAGEYGRFFDCLARASRQGWLGDFARRQALQAHVLTLLLNDEGWPPELFERVCQTFAWDAVGAVPPVADEQWQALRRRFEQRTWLNELHTLADQHKHDPRPDANAAALFLLAPDPTQQKKLAAGFIEADWQACERLAEAFSARFPDLLGLFPNHDPWFWKKLIEPRDPPYGVKRTVGVLTVALALQGLPGSTPIASLLILPLYAIGALLAAKMGHWLFSHWAQFAMSIQDIDQRVSEWCASKKITRDRRYLVIRNAGPLLGLAFVIWKWLGALGLATYVLTGVIGMLQPQGMGPQDREYRWRKPLQAIYRIAGLSWLQWLFCIVMVVVIGYVRLQGS